MKAFALRRVFSPAASAVDSSAAPSPTSSEASRPNAPTFETLRAAVFRDTRPFSGSEAAMPALPKPRGIDLFKTLRRTWPQDYPRPQFAFRISMLNVSCNSHYLSQLAASFIDTRAE